MLTRARLATPYTPKRQRFPGLLPVLMKCLIFFVGLYGMVLVLLAARRWIF